MQSPPGRIKIKASKNVVQHAESSVVISDVSDSDSGIYKCVAKTDLDNAEAEAELTVQDVPQVRAFCKGVLIVYYLGHSWV